MNGKQFFMKQNEIISLGSIASRAAAFQPLNFVVSSFSPVVKLFELDFYDVDTVLNNILGNSLNVFVQKIKFFMESTQAISIAGAGRRGSLLKRRSVLTNASL